MVSAKDKKHESLAERGKYAALHDYLQQIEIDVWETTFSEIEMILGFPLPKSARLHRPWWGNQKTNNGHSQAWAWESAGWQISDVDVEREKLIFKRQPINETRKTLDEDFDFEKFWPVHDCGQWPEGLSLRREDMYDERI